MPLQHRHGYAAGPHRGLPTSDINRSRSSPPSIARWVRVAAWPQSASIQPLDGQHADFETHWGEITPLLSQTAAGRQLGGTPRESQPIQVADGSRANPANDLPDATAQQPQRPAPRYKSAVQQPNPQRRNPIIRRQTPKHGYPSMRVTPVGDTRGYGSCRTFPPARRVRRDRHHVPQFPEGEAVLVLGVKCCRVICGDWTRDRWAGPAALRMVEAAGLGGGCGLYVPDSKQWGMTPGKVRSSVAKDRWGAVSG